jgi:hypothetical protein
MPSIRRWPSGRPRHEPLDDRRPPRAAETRVGLPAPGQGLEVGVVAAGAAVPGRRPDGEAAGVVARLIETAGPAVLGTRPIHTR